MRTSSVSVPLLVSEFQQRIKINMIRMQRSFKHLLLRPQARRATGRCLRACTTTRLVQRFSSSASAPQAHAKINESLFPPRDLGGDIPPSHEGASSGEVATDARPPPSSSSGVATPRLTEEQLKGKSKKLKRFYETVTAKKAEVADHESQGAGESHQLLLDDKVLKSPDQNPLRIPSQIVADLVRNEWDAQKDLIDAEKMPIHTLLCTAVDQMWSAEQRKDEIQRQLLKFLETDTLCFVGTSSTNTPEALEKKQEELWGPVRERFCSSFGVELNTTAGSASFLRLETHPEATFTKIHKVLETMSPWRLTAVSLATQQLKSLILAMDLLVGGEGSRTESKSAPSAESGDEKHVAREQAGERLHQFAATMTPNKTSATMSPKGHIRASSTCTTASTKTGELQALHASPATTHEDLCAVKKAIDLSMLEEQHQRDFWGSDDESFARGRAEMEKWILSCRLFAKYMPA
ncbi:unnamed protein product [Amoebophrya sp. A25]|nr:unnamed protein product [Amoebophrya sp. A25]|eukprot:GSA25T00003333001.1